MTEIQRQAVEFSDDELSAGQRLREAREAQGLSVEDVAARLNISVKYIQALEDLDFDSLPGLPFVRGYIRSYARFVELSGDELVVSFNQYAQVGDAGPVASINKVERQVKLSDPLMRISMYVFFLAVLGISVWWWQTQSGNSLADIFHLDSGGSAEAQNENTLTDKQSESIAAEDSLQARLAAVQAQSEKQLAMSETEIDSTNSGSDDATPQYLSAEEVQQMAAELGKPNEMEGNQNSGDGESADSTVSNTNVASEVVVASPSEAGNEIESSVETTALSEQTSNDAVDASVSNTDNSNQENGLSQQKATSADNEQLSNDVTTSDVIAETAKKLVGKLELQFTGDCWISIRDANGKLVFANTKRAGDVLALDLEASANLLVGRVSAVSHAFFGGKDLQLAQIARKDVARLELNL